MNDVDNANKDGALMIMTSEDWAILSSPTEWLNDTVIDVAQTILFEEHPLVDSQTPAVAYATGFDAAIVQGLQVHNDNNVHWLLSSTLRMRVEIFDSLSSGDLSENIKTQLLDKYRSLVKDGYLDVFIAPVSQQTNSFDCGLHVIANMTEILLGGDPMSINYVEKQMRAHLLHCLKNHHFEKFPSKNRCGRKGQFKMLKVGANEAQTTKHIRFATNVKSRGRPRQAGHQRRLPINFNGK